jgi:hypothetical protein
MARLSPAARQAVERWGVLQGESEEGLDGARMRELFERLGLQFEARLAAGETDGAGGALKPALFEAARLLRDSGSPLAAETEQLAQTVELFQLSQLRLQSQGLTLLPLFLPFAADAYLLVRERAAAAPGEEEPPLSVSLHLALQGLGNMRVDLLQDGQGLHVRFVCSGTTQAAFVAGHREELGEALADCRLQGVSFAAGADPPVRDLVRLLLPDGNGFLDTRV